MTRFSGTLLLGMTLSLQVLSRSNRLDLTLAINEHFVTFLTYYLSLGSLGTILRSTLCSLGDARRIQSATNRVVSHTWQILDSTASDQNNRVLLQIVTFTADIARDFHTIGQPHTTDLPKR